MDTVGFVNPDALPPRLETEADRLARIKREEAVIARAEADIDAGLGLDHDQVEAWLDALDRDEDTPLPTPR